jgi:FAD:protein FMN transferase
MRRRFTSLLCTEEQRQRPAAIVGLEQAPPSPRRGPSCALGRAARAVLLIPALGFTIFSHSADLPLVIWQGQTMGSTYTVKVVGTNLAPEQVKALQGEVELRLKEVNRQISHYQPDSELSRFNRAPANTPFRISPAFAVLVRQSIDLNRRSDGAFDPTVSPLINLWGFGETTPEHKVPTDAQLAEARRSSGFAHLRLTTAGELIKDIPGLQLNFGANGKGFGVDEMARVLQRHGFANFYVSISGEVFVIGRNPKGAKWQVGIPAPVANWRPGGPVATVLSLSGQAVSTSGDYQKYFVDAQGRRLCHIIDPKTGWPVQHNLGSVSVVAHSSTTADALSTTVFVLGPEAGLSFIETCTNAAALFIVREAEGKFRSVPSSRFAGMTGYKP